MFPATCLLPPLSSSRMDHSYHLCRGSKLIHEACRGQLNLETSNYGYARASMRTYRHHGDVDNDASTFTQRYFFCGNFVVSCMCSYRTRTSNQLRLLLGRENLLIVREGPSMASGVARNFEQERLTTYTRASRSGSHQQIANVDGEDAGSHSPVC